MAGKSGLRFGILCNSMQFQQWQAEIIRTLISNGHHPALIIMGDEKLSDQPPGSRLRNYPWKNMLYRLHQRYIFNPTMKQETDMRRELEKVPVQICKIRKVDFSEFFYEEDVAFIESRNLDFLLRFGFNIIRGGILNAAKFGVWSFHHGDEKKYRGGPPCFWEIYRNDKSTGAILQRLNEKLDAGIILRKGWFGTINHSYTENLNRVYAGSIPWVLQVCKDIEQGNSGYLEGPGSSTRAPVYRIPGNLKMLWFLLKLLGNRIAYHARNLLLAEVWNIGLIDAPLEKVAFNWNVYKKKVRWLPQPRGSKYQADPFAYNLGDVNRLVFESYDYKKMAAHLEQISLEETKLFNNRVEVLNTGSHLSFPYLFEHETEVYCIPESSASGRTSLYRLDCSETHFEKVCDILQHPLIDPAIIRWGGYWWLFGSKAGYPSENLYIYYAENINGPYSGHENNPVKTNVRSARSAGKLFISGDTLYRPAQNCSKTYGGSIIINQILKLNTRQFAEQEVLELLPANHWEFKKGMHTISGTNKITLIDAKKYCFIPLATWKKLTRKF